MISGVEPSLSNASRLAPLVEGELGLKFKLEIKNSDGNSDLKVKVFVFRQAKN